MKKQVIKKTRVEMKMEIFYEYNINILRGR